MKQSLRMVSRTALASAGLALLLAAIASAALASSVTYTYTGNDFDNYEASAPWTTSDFVTASFTFVSPLPDNLPTTFLFAPGSAVTASEIESWTVNDGVSTYDPGDGATLLNFILATGPSGNITTWSFNVYNPTLACKPHAFSGWNGGPSSGDAQDEGEYDEPCPPYPAPSVGANVGYPGHWTESQAVPPAVPEPTTTVLITIGGATLLVARRRKQRKSLATQEI